jgi:hypothetical protein
MMAPRVILVPQVIQPRLVTIPLLALLEIAVLRVAKAPTGIQEIVVRVVTEVQQDLLVTQEIQGHLATQVTMEQEVPGGQQEQEVPGEAVGLDMFLVVLQDFLVEPVVLVVVQTLL